MPTAMPWRWASVLIGCGVGSLGGRRPILAPYVTGMEPTDGATPPEDANAAYGAASLLVANWSGASPDEGRFPVRPSRLTPSGGQR